MKRYKFITILVVFVLALFFISCTENRTDSIALTAKVKDDQSIIPTKVQFGIDRVYNYKVVVESNYSPLDSIYVKAYFTNGINIVDINLYDDGVSDDSLRSDLVASNNTWSGGINSNDFPNEGIWQLNVDILVANSIVINEHIFSDILVNQNTSPEITSIIGIEGADTLESGFDTKILTISIIDPDNDALGYNDNQTLKLEIRNRDNIDKDYEFVREDPLSDMIISLDSTLASGLATNDNYTLTFIATDYYGEADSLEIRNIRIENTAPTIKNVEYPDSINTTESGVFWVYTQINDSQGHLSHQDIDKVEIVINSTPYELLDDGDFAMSGDENENDGIYTIGFSYDVGDSGFFSMQILAYDKAGNISSPVDGNITLYSEKNNNNIGNSNAEKFNYSNPFNTK